MLGREDESDGEEKITVLTQNVCLIPGDEPVVRVEDAPGNARRIFTGVDIRASVEDVWSVMTDYEGLEQVVPNLVHNEILTTTEDGGARLWQIGRASWEILGKHLHFQAGSTLDVRLFPGGLPEEHMAGAHVDASMLSCEAREFGRGLKLVRGVFPRPFSLCDKGVPVHDITMQNVCGERGDFVHYQGVWRLQPLDACAPPGQDMMRLTFAVECEPHWFLPVAPVEGRIASALVENMEAIRNHVESKLASRPPSAKAPVPVEEPAANELDFGKLAESALQSIAAPAWAFLNGGKDPLPTQAQRRRRADASRNCLCGLRPRRRVRSRIAAHAAVAAPEAEALVEAMTESLERAEAGAMLESGTTAFLSTLVELAAGLETETVLAASVAAGLVAVAVNQNQQDELAAIANDGDDAPAKAWVAVCMQHPASVQEGHFLGMRFDRRAVERRWPRFVQTLGVGEEQALEIVEADATPLLVEPDDIAEVLSRLAAISSREKALELVGYNPALLVGGVPALKEGKDLGVSILVDVLYAGRLTKVLEEAGRDAGEKVTEIEWYSYAVSGLKPLVDFVQRGGLRSSTMKLCRRPIEIAAQVVPNNSMRVFLNQLAVVPDPLAFLWDQAKAGLLMTSSLVVRPTLASSIMPYSPSILPHLPSIYTRLSILRPHIPGIVRILDPYFSVVEPHLDRIMERMDQIEPHLPYILIHLDVLAKHCGPLLDHFDELMPYASSKAEIGRAFDEWAACYGDSKANADAIAECLIESWEEERPAHEIERAVQEESYLPRLLPYVDFLVPRLNVLAPHLPLVHPHLPHILPYIDELLPYIPLFAAHPRASANADVLVGYLGWMLKVPVVHRILYVPWVPRIVAKLSTVLPRRLIRPTLERRRRRYEQAESLSRATGKEAKAPKWWRRSAPG